MKSVRLIAIACLAVVAVLSCLAPLAAPHDYAAQFREHVNEAPSRTFPLGTDELGRDRASRLLYATRISLFFALATALVTLSIAVVIGLAAGYFPGWPDTLARLFMDLFVSLPWLFLLLTLRALLPLDVSPVVSVAATFAFLALVGWASGARVIRAAVAGLRTSPHVLYAKACGCTNWRVLRAHLLPNLRPVIAAQFWILVPVFLISEANLGMLGLGVVEPMPSWGSMLLELRNYERIPEAPWILTPAFLLILVVASLHFVVSGTKTWE
jgi:ABC-type dipeptide/oligopeptide/nickel transport system permease subunit